MGVSVLVPPRPPHAVVMAPALTETGQAQSYNPLTKSSLNILDECDLTTHIIVKPKRNSQEIRFKLSDFGFNGSPPKRGRPLRPLEVVGCGADSSMNFNSPMGDQFEDMGMLKSNPAALPADGQENLNFMKSNDVEQLLAVIPPPNVDELMRAISTMESEASESAYTGELDLTGADIASIEEGLLMSGVDWPEPELESASSVKEALVSEKQAEDAKSLAQSEKRTKRLLKRLKRLQLRGLGTHVAKQLAAVLDNSAKSLWKCKEGELPCSVTDLNRFLDKLHCSSYAQCQSGMRFRPPIRYFGSGSLDCQQTQDHQLPGAVLPKLDAEERNALQAVSQQLRTELSVLQKQFDSDATESSSGADSCDESVSYNNQVQSHLSIKKRAYWRWQQDRGAIANRWTWLMNQIVDLDYKIRAFTEHQRHFRSRRGTVTLGNNCPISPVSVNGYHGALPGGGVHKTQGEDPAADPSAVSARTRPFVRSHFRKRTLFRSENLHLAKELPKMERVTRASTVRCWCRPPATQCLVCTGRPDPTLPDGWPEPAGTTAVPERIAALDPAFHPVLSFPHDVPLGLHLDSVMKLHEWQSKTNRSSYKYKKTPREKVPKVHKPAPAASGLSAKLLKTKLAVNRKRRRDVKGGDDHSLQPVVPPITIKKARNHSSISGGDSGDEGDLYVAATTVEPLSPGTTVSAAGSTTEREEVRRSRHRENDSFDINNIVIPYSMAATARVEMLPYKEIPTPKWRYVEDCKDKEALESTSEEEDVSEEAVMERHARSEDAERRKFMKYIKQPLMGRGRVGRRADSRAESSGANTPDPMSPMNPEHGDSLMTTPPATPQAADDASAVLARRRTTSSSKTLALRDRSLSPDPPDEVLAYEPRTYPLTEEELEAMGAVMQSMRSCERRKEGEQPDYTSRTPESPSSSSTISAEEVGEEEDLEDPGEDQEDPNDPDWRAADSPHSSL